MKRRNGLLPLILLALAAPTALAGQMDQRAADLYDDGVRLIRVARYAEGEALIRQALARGAVEPNEAQGCESRYLVRRYDPYYWLGVARMEQGDDAEALELFVVSETWVPKGNRVPVITKWRPEYEDLKRRRAALASRREPDER